MPYYKYCISIASVFVPFEANVLLYWNWSAYFYYKWADFLWEWEAIFKCINAHLTILLYNIALTCLKQFFCLYESQSAYFYCKLAGWYLCR